jgi:hypothetical protein
VNGMFHGGADETVSISRELKENLIDTTLYNQA